MRNFANRTIHSSVMISNKDYIQLQAYTRYDGALTAVIWTVSFALYIAGISNPLSMMAGMGLAVFSPFFIALRLRRFRDGACNGCISFRRAYVYSFSVFCHAALLFAVAQYVYFAFIDNGYLVGCMTELLNEREAKQMIQGYGMEKAVEESLQAIRTVRPIDYALNNLSLNFIIGLAVSLPIAGTMKRDGSNG